MGLTVHFFNEEEGGIKLETYTADLCAVDALSITGPVVKSSIVNIFSGLGVNEEELPEFLCVVTDRGSNMLAAVTDLDSEVCVAHLLNNVVGSMLKLEPVKEITSKAAHLVRYMKTSHAGALMTSKLKSYPDTRFNYAIDMLKSIYDNHEEVFQILTAKEDATRNKHLSDKITCLSMPDIKSMCDFLVIFKNMTTAIEGDQHVTLHKVWPVFRELRSILKPHRSDSDLIAQMRAADLQYINKTENQQYFSPSDRHKLALFLHPLMNQLTFLTFRGKLCVNLHKI